MKIKQDIGLHNEFRIERRKAIFHDDGTWTPGELVQEAFAYNLILDRGIQTVYGQLSMSTGLNNAGYRFMRGTVDLVCFGGAIQVGSGSGTLASTRTGLFTHLLTKSTAFHAREIGTDWASYTQTMTIQPEELVGATITEVGLSRSGGATNQLNTHAVLQDSEGNPISFGPKTNLEVLVVYATVYMQTSTITTHLHNKRVIGRYTGPSMLELVYRNFHTVKPYLNIFARNIPSMTKGVFMWQGPDGRPVDWYTAETEKAFMARILQVAPITTQSFDAATGIMTLYHRIDNTTLNGNRVRAVSIFQMERMAEFAYLLGTGVTSSFFATNFQRSITEIIGAGDGVTTEFSSIYDDFVVGSDEVRVAGILQTRGTDYTINGGLKGAKSILPFSTINVDTLSDEDYALFFALSAAILNAETEIGGKPATGLTGQYVFDIEAAQPNTVSDFQVAYGYFGHGYPTNLTLERYDEGTLTWIKLLDNVALSGSSYGTQTLSFTAVTAQRFRITIGRTDATAFSLVGLLLRAASKPTITFTTPPASGDIQLIGTINGLPKDDTHVLDITQEIKIKDANAV